MSRVVVVVPPPHEVLSASGDGLPQQATSVRGAIAPRVYAIVPYRARTGGAAKNSVKFPLDSYSIVYGGEWCKPEFFHNRRWHAVKTQVVGTESVDMSCLVWRQPREDFWRDG